MHPLFNVSMRWLLERLSETGQVILCRPFTDTLPQEGEDR
jgi:hypothetical protein